ncbi:MAG: hypothetical protein QF886_25050, partial [Planctomycetota bacterium]|nr:hypothetical protein [Planctomycetota bacterium]
CEPATHVDARAMGWAGYHVDTTMKERLDAMPYQNSLWQSRYPKLIDIWEDEPASPKGNIIARNICVGGKWDEFVNDIVHLISFDSNLIDEDPHFIDAENRNYQLADDSPAWELGFQRIPVEQIGPNRKP